MSAELKPCPFCGSTDIRFMGGIDDRGGVAVYCAGADCNCTMGANWDRDAMPDHAYRNEGHAAEAWNRRATPAPGAPGQEATTDELIELSAALERRRCIVISETVKTVAPRWHKDGKPTPFSAGFEIACEEIAHRIEHEEWVLEVPDALPPSGAGEKTS